MNKIEFDGKALNRVMIDGTTEMRLKRCFVMLPDGVAGGEYRVTLEPVSNKPSWDDAPEGFDWLAQDEDGSWWFYREKPRCVSSIGWWESGSAWSSGFTKDNPNPNWRDTLERRPEKTVKADTVKIDVALDEEAIEQLRRVDGLLSWVKEHMSTREPSGDVQWHPMEEFDGAYTGYVLLGEKDSVDSLFVGRSNGMGSIEDCHRKHRYYHCKKCERWHQHGTGISLTHFALIGAPE